ncbi:MAG: hypothetical protein AB1349_10190 [Elusimicrobiota bacterium]
MARVKRFSELIGFFKLLIAGFKANASDFSSFQQDVKTLDSLISQAEMQNQKQEDAEAKYHQLTEELNRIMKDAKGLSARLTSAVYARYGKKSDRLEEFGLKAWKSGGKKGKRKA